MRLIHYYLFIRHSTAVYIVSNVKYLEVNHLMRGFIIIVDTFCFSNHIKCMLISVILSCTFWILIR